MVRLPPGEYCPDCGGKLLYNGSAMVCIRCPFAMPKPDSQKCIPAVQRQPEPPDRK
jgi:hypothetical protein